MAATVHKPKMGAGKLGFTCECGQRFVTEKLLQEHLTDEQAVAADNKRKEEAKVPEQPKPAEQPKTEAKPAEAAPAAKPAAPADKPIEGEVVQRGRNVAVAISNMDIADQMVLKYATTLINSEAAAEFQTRMKLIQRLNPKLAQVSPQSLFMAMMACVHLRLMPNTTEQLAHIIPYGNEAQFQIGYKGLAELAYRTGNVVKIDQEVVFKGDEFDWSLGLDRKLTHKPNAGVDRTKYENVVAAYATVKLKDGEILFEVVTKPELDKIKNSAKASGPGTPWATWPAEMAKKTATKRLAKLLPTSKEDNRIKIATELDSLQEAGKRLTIDAETGEISAADKNAVNPETEQAINDATTKEQISDILQGLPVEERKHAAGVATARIKELG